MIEPDNLIPVSGASIRSTEDLWSKVLGWMDAPIERVESRGTRLKAEGAGQASGEVSVPFVAQGKANVEAKVGGETSREIRESFEIRGLHQVIKEISGSTFAVFVDDFHYIPKEIQKDIGKQIKEAAERGVRIITASVPHRTDDVVRSNTELRGRVTAIDIDYWKQEELEQIAYRGFRELNVDIAATIMNRLTTEAFGSPQLMQAIALHFCFENKVYETLPDLKRIEIDFVTLQSVLERTSTLTDFSSMLATLHAGPKQRGTERKEFLFTDRSKGDVYRHRYVGCLACCSLAGLVAIVPCSTRAGGEGESSGTFLVPTPSGEHEPRRGHPILQWGRSAAEHRALAGLTA